MLSILNFTGKGQTSQAMKVTEATKVYSTGSQSMRVFLRVSIYDHTIVIINYSVLQRSLKNVAFLLLQLPCKTKSYTSLYHDLIVAPQVQRPNW